MKGKKAITQERLNKAHEGHASEPNRGPSESPGKAAAPSKPGALSGPLGIFKRRMKPHGSDQ